MCTTVRVCSVSLHLNWQLVPWIMSNEKLNYGDDKSNRRVGLRSHDYMQIRLLNLAYFVVLYYNTLYLLLAGLSNIWSRRHEWSPGQGSCHIRMCWPDCRGLWTIWYNRECVMLAARLCHFYLTGVFLQWIKFFRQVKKYHSGYVMSDCVITSTCNRWLVSAPNSWLIPTQRDVSRQHKFCVWTHLK